MLKVAVFAIFAVLTLGMLYVVTHLAGLLDTARHRRRGVTFTRLLQVMGVWEISVGAVIITTGYWVSAIGPIGLGAAMLFGGPAYARLMSKR